MTSPTHDTTERQQEPRDTDESSLARVVEALRPFMPITTRDGPDYAEVTFGDHQSQAMTMAPNDWKALNDAYAEALSLLSPEGGGKGAAAWQPIESAPRDGTHILICTYRGPHHECLPATVHWWDNPGEEGWTLSVNMRAEDSEYVWGPPTHWQPLPAPPADGKVLK